MKLGDLIGFQDGDDNFLGVVTFIDVDLNYCEISDQDPCINGLYTFNDQNWKSVDYYEDENGNFFGKSGANDYSKIVIQEEGSGDYIEERKIVEDETYSIITKEGNNAVKPGSSFQVIDINANTQVITCIDVDIEDAEEIEIDVSKGISRKVEHYHGIYDFCAQVFDDDDDDDDDEFEPKRKSSAKKSPIKQDEEIFAIKGYIAVEERELTEHEKREEIFKAIKKIFPIMKSHDTLSLTNTVYDSFNMKIDTFEDEWKNKITTGSSSQIHPKLASLKLANLEHDQKELRYESYDDFIEKNIRNLVYDESDNIIDTTPISNRVEAVDSRGEIVVLNSAYTHNNRPIKNTTDQVAIRGYTVGNTGQNIDKLPPTVEEFQTTYARLKGEAFDTFNIHERDLHTNYLSGLKLDKQLSHRRFKNPLFKKKSVAGYNIPKLNGVLQSLGNFEFPKSEKKKMPSNVNDILTEFTWDNKKIWPRSRAIEKLKVEFSIDKKKASQLINNLEGDTEYNFDVYVEEHYKKFTKKGTFVGTKLRELPTLSGNKKTMFSDLIKHKDSSKSNDEWSKIQNMNNSKEKDQMILEFFVSGKYVRDSEKGENPYYFYDVFTGNKFLPKHLLQSVQARLSDSMEEFNCMIHQWGVEEDDTRNIVSIINGDVIGYKDDIHDFNHNRDIRKQIHNEPINLEIIVKDENDIYNLILRDCFSSSFRMILDEFSTKKQFRSGISVSFAEFKKCASKFFESNDWNNYYETFGRLDMDTIPDMKKTKWRETVEKVSRFDSEIKTIFSKYKGAVKQKNDKVQDAAMRKINKLLRMPGKRRTYHAGLFKKTGLFITSYFYSGINLDKDAILRILEEFFENDVKHLPDAERPVWAVDKATFEPKNIVKFAVRLWSFRNEDNEKFTYSYKRKIDKCSKLIKENKSGAVISKEVSGFDTSNIDFSTKQAKLLEKTHNPNRTTIELSGWTAYENKSIRLASIEWALLDDDAEENLEIKYKCLIHQITKTLLGNNVPREKNYVLPLEWKPLKEKKYDDVIDTWIVAFNETKSKIKSNDDFEAFREIIEDELILLKRFITETNVPISYRDLWCYLIHHFDDDMNDKRIQMNKLGSLAAYKLVFEETITAYVHEVLNLCGELKQMTKSVVEMAHAKANEDEAQGMMIHKQEGDDKFKKILNEQAKRGFGIYARGKGAQHVLDANAPIFVENNPEVAEMQGFDDDRLGDEDGNADDAN